MFLKKTFMRFGDFRMINFRTKKRTIHYVLYRVFF